MTTITLTADHLHQLDLAPAEHLILAWLAQGAILSHEQTVEFAIDYPRDPSDPRELSEIPEVRLWFVRLDARYPWFPFLLNWKQGELARYMAMLVPHQFNRREGIQFNPEALELMMMHKIFVLADWLRQNEVDGTARLKSMAQMLGYELEDGFFAMLG